jgi:AcrR family transcriptional regulator
MRPPPGRQQLSREFIARHQRARIVDALAEETMEKGYQAVTVADIVRRAGIARNTFYENFSSKEACFLAAQAYAADEAMRRVVEAAAEIESWQGRVNAGLTAFLAAIAEEPALARLSLVEAYSAGGEAQARLEESMQSFVPLFKVGRTVSPHGDELPDTLEEWIVGGIGKVLTRRLVEGKTDEVEKLREELVEFYLTPYIGAKAAKRAAAEAVPGTSD